MNNEEKLLRENIRKIVQIVRTRKNEEKEQSRLEEKMLRKVVRALLKEEPVADFAPNQSTGINVLEELLKKIIPVLEEDFKSLTTNEEQRDSFRAHIVNGIESLLAPAAVNADAPIPGEEDALQELLKIINEVEVTVGDSDEDMPEEFIDSYDVLADDEDREIFYDYLITNVKLYFDRFESELAPTVDEPSTPEYDERAAGKEPEEEFALEEYIDLDGLLESIHI